jgi:two-component system response regulator HydG
MNPRVLIVDDVRAECRLIADTLQSADFEPQWVLSGAEALLLLEAQSFDAVVTDLNMPHMDGISLCRRITETSPHLPVVVITAFGSIDSAVDAMKAGAYDFITKPFDIDAVSLVLRRAVEHKALKCEVDTLRQIVDKTQCYGKLLGTSLAMRRVYDLIEGTAESESPVLITGESGTGKELLAREIHQRGRSPNGPFVVVNCTTIPGTLLEGEIFGYTEQALTDAQTERDGCLVSASGGTMFLDEISEMSLDVQARLLRVLQEQSVKPIDGDNNVDFSMRIIAATNRDLDAALESGRLREDLFYRINVIHIEMPPVRARSGDALLLAQHFLGEISARNGKSVNGFTVAAAERVLAYAWPGNVRELRNCVERAVALCRTTQVDIGELPERVRNYEPRHILVAGDDPSELVPLEEVERRYILRVIEACQRNKSQAARILGIGRKTLYRRLIALGVSVSEEE